MSVIGMSSTSFSSWGQTTGSVEVSFGASTVFMQCSLSGVADTPSGWAYFVGIGRYQTHNLFGGPTTHDFTTGYYAPPNSIYDVNVINVSFYHDMWGDDDSYIVGLCNIFYFG